MPLVDPLVEGAIGRAHKELRRVLKRFSAIRVAEADREERKRAEEEAEVKNRAVARAAAAVPLQAAELILSQARERGAVGA